MSPNQVSQSFFLLQSQDNNPTLLKSNRPRHFYDSRSRSRSSMPGQPPYEGRDRTGGDAGSVRAGRLRANCWKTRFRCSGGYMSRRIPMEPTWQRVGCAETAHAARECRNLIWAAASTHFTLYMNNSGRQTRLAQARSLCSASGSRYHSRFWPILKPLACSAWSMASQPGWRRSSNPTPPLSM